MTNAYIKIGSDLTPPKAILTLSSQFAGALGEGARSQNKHTKGVVVLSGYVGKDGKFHDAKVVRSLNPALDSVALKTVAQWQFQPCMRKSVPVNCATGVEISFDLY